MMTVENTVIRVRDFMEMAATRSRGARFYDALHSKTHQLDHDSGVTISFKDVGFVSPSFLDETVVRLLQEHPELWGKVSVSGLSDLASQGLEKVLSARGVSPTALLRG